MATTDVNTALGTETAPTPRPRDAEPPRGSDDTVPAEPARTLGVIAALMMASLVAGLDLSMLAAVMGRGSLGHATGISPTVTFAYLAAALVVAPICGKLGDAFGHKRPFQVSAVVFIAGAGMLTWADGTIGVIVSRTMQGVGLGGLMVGAIAIVSGAGAARGRAVGTALVLAAFAASYALGPALAGVVTSDRSWRWCVYVEIVLSTLALVLASTTVRRVGQVHRHGTRRPDLLGALLLAVASIGAVAATRWERLGLDWNSTRTIGLAAAVVLAVLLFVLIERNVADPLVPSGLFRDRTCALSGIVGLIVGAGVFGTLDNVSAVVQQFKGTSAGETLVLALPLAGGIVVAALGAGVLLTRPGRYRLVAVPGALVAAVGLGGLSLMASDSPRWQDALSMVGLGIGTGLLLPVLVLAVQGSAPSADVGVVSAAAVYVRQLGACVGIGIFGAVSSAGEPQRAFSYAVPALALAAVLALLLQDRPVSGIHPSPGPATIPSPGQQAGGGRGSVGARPTPPPPDERPYERSNSLPGSRFDPTTHLDDNPVEHRNDISVRVRQADGRPVPGVVLTLCDLAGGELGRSVALGDGAYVLAAPAPGAYLVIASVQGYHPLAHVVDVREPQTDVELDLSGESGAYGFVRNGTGDPVPGATVALAAPHGEVVARASTGTDGSFALTDLRPGAYTLAVSALGYRPVARAVRILDAGRVLQDVELVGGGHLHGTIRGSAGNPLRDARVTLVDSGGRVARVTASGPSGHYRFSEVAEGDYTVVASMYPPTASRVHVAGGEQHQHDVELSYPDV